jgi:pimeloyl-ACP methyl ester carboxylesterase
MTITTVRKALLVIATLIIAAPLLGWAWQHFCEARDDRRYPPPGRLVDVDGHLMHIHCQGKGSPTVIVEQGIGAQPLSWAPLNQRLAGITTVCAYDRAGMGYSDPLDHFTVASEVAARLHSLLTNAGIDDDIVLVGWSAGGMYAREYYRRYPARVKGMVLVDSSHEQQMQRMSIPDDWADNPLHVDQYLAPFGWIRLRGDVDRQFAKSSLPPDIRARLIAIKLKSRLPRTMVAEGDGFRADLAANRTPPSLGSLPLIVISEGKPGEGFMQDNLRTWFELQDELAHLSTRGRHIVATQSGHAIHSTEPELIVESVRTVVETARTDSR